MNNETVYAVTTLENGRMRQYIFVHETVEFWGENVEQFKLRQAFASVSGIPLSNVIDIRESGFLYALRSSSLR